MRSRDDSALSSLPRYPFFQITVSKSSEGTVSSELTIAEVKWDDGGLYSCVAREVVGGGAGGGVDVAAPPKMQKIFLDVFSGAEVRIDKGRGICYSCQTLPQGIQLTQIVPKAIFVGQISLKTNVISMKR